MHSATLANVDNLTTEDGWLALRDEGLAPLYSSGYATTQDDRDDFLAGAAMLRFHGDHARPGHTVKPQQLRVVDTLAPGQSRTALLMPRRSSKTTSLVALALGRASRRPDYRVGILTLTSGKAGRARFLKDVAPALERVATAKHGPTKRDWPYVVGRSAGQEGVTFRDTDGIVSWLSSVDDLRGEAFDMIILDEAQAADPEKVADVVAAALPTLDTRPDAQIVVAGTAGKWRIGNLLHDWLEHGRAGSWGILEFAAPEDTDPELLDSWETTAPLVLASHPGVGTLTTLDAIQGNWLALKRDQFAQEYLGLWGKVGEGSGVLSAAKWLAAGLGAKRNGPDLLEALGGEYAPDADALPNVPDWFGLAAVSHVNQTTAALVAAWRDDSGRACGYVLDYRRGTQWLADAAASKARQHKKPVIYDSASSPVRVEVEVMERMTPKPQTEARTTSDVAAAHALLAKDVNEGNARHWHQPMMDAAAKDAVRRPVGPGRWMFGRGKDPDADIIALEGWAMALHWYDENPAPVRRRAIVSTS
jgi:hypothetical protein